MFGGVTGRGFPTAAVSTSPGGIRKRESVELPEAAACEIGEDALLEALTHTQAESSGLCSGGGVGDELIAGIVNAFAATSATLEGQPQPPAQVVVPPPASGSAPPMKLSSKDGSWIATGASSGQVRQDALSVSLSLALCLSACLPLSVCL